MSSWDAKVRSKSVVLFFRVLLFLRVLFGFEAEHHERALNGLPHTRFRLDHAARRYGILTTEEVKYGMMTLFKRVFWNILF
jgi:hypothetical protein